MRCNSIHGSFVAGKMLARKLLFSGVASFGKYGAPSDWGVRVLREHYKAQRKLVTSDAVSDDPGYQTLILQGTILASTSRRSYSLVES
jgi:hypothetical protein